MKIFSIEAELINMANITLCVLPLVIVWKVKRSYILGLSAIVGGLIILGISLTISVLVSYTPTFDIVEHNIYQTLLLNTGMPKASLIVAISYGLIVAGIFLLLNQFIAESFLGKNKQ